MKDIVRTSHQRHQDQAIGQLLAPPIISAAEAESVKDALSTKFLENAELTQSWMETGLDDWLETGQRWLAAAKFGVIKGKYLQIQPDGVDKCRPVLTQAFTDLMKAS